MPFTCSTYPFVPGVCYGSPINVDVVVIIEPEEFLPHELCVVVGYDGVWDSESVDDIREEQHDLLGFDHGDRPSLYTLRELVHDNKCVKPSGALLKGPTRSSPQTANGHVMGIVWSAWADRRVC